jgi:hypothetical protein
MRHNKAGCFELRHKSFSGSSHMSILSSRAAALAALFAAAQLAACGGNDTEKATATAAPAPVASPAPAPAPTTPAPPATNPLPVTGSPLKALQYTLQGPGDGNGDSSAGQVGAPTASSATLSLSGGRQTTLAVDTSNNGFAITSPDYYVVNRYAGAVLMLCDPTTAPGTTTAHYVAVASVAAQGGVAAEAVTSASALAGMRFFKLSNCSYQSGNGSQGQHDAANADTLQLEFDAGGNASSTALAGSYSAAQFSDMLASGSMLDGARFTAYRFMVDGQPQFALVERGTYDASNPDATFVRLWLPQ